MAVEGDGNLYWTTNGADSSYQQLHYFWRYDVGAASGVSEMRRFREVLVAYVSEAASPCAAGCCEARPDFITVI